MSTPKIHIVLHQPEIPQNTGNIARTCAATGATLHLIRPLGFTIDDKRMKRAGLDYWDKLGVQFYDDLEDFYAKNPNAVVYYFTTKAQHRHTDVAYPEEVFLMFGKETAGLPQWLREKYRDRCIRIPMISQARSLNLSNSVAVLAYEALRQQGFPGLLDTGSMAAE